MKKIRILCLTAIMIVCISSTAYAEEDLTFLTFALGLNTGMYDYIYVTSGSMKPAFSEDDTVVVNLFAYENQAPERGDIIEFRYPVDGYFGKESIFVQRIIGLPGETVTIDNGEIYINDSEKPLDEPYLLEEWVVRNDGFLFEIPDNCYLMMGDNRNNSNDSRYWPEKAIYQSAQEGNSITAEEAENLAYVKREDIIGKVVSKIVFEPIK